MHRVTRHDRRPIAETEALKLNIPANMVTRIVLRNFLFVAIVMSVIFFSAAFKKGHDVSFLSVQMEGIV